MYVGVFSVFLAWSNTNYLDLRKNRGVGAYAAPPPEGTKLSEIVAKVEQTTDVDYVDEVDWNDRGYYEIEYYMKNGAKAEIKIDPKTGESVK